MSDLTQIQNQDSDHDISAIRADFPVLSQSMNGHPLIYLDSAATAQKPVQVIDAMHTFLSTQYATVHRGIYQLSQTSTQYYDQARQKVATFMNAQSDQEIVFTKHATESINLVAHGIAQQLSHQDDVIVSAVEHHANFVPWQQLSKRYGFNLKIIPVFDNGDLDMDAYKALLSPNTRCVAIAHVSNVLGTVFPVKEIVQLAHQVHAQVLVDGCQAVPHLKVDVQDLDCDYYCFSGHKLYGPTGIGVLYGKRTRLAALPPYQMGGDMIESVTLDATTFAEPPLKFEAGTPPIVEAIGLGVAIDYISNIGFAQIEQHNQHLLRYAAQKLKSVAGIRIIGESEHKIGVISFLLDDIHPHDIGTILDQQGIAIRAGHHCSQITMARFGVAATARISFGIYTQDQDIDTFIDGLSHVKSVMSCP